MHLGYPVYFITILGFWKVLGAIALLAPRFPRLKEWAYAGIFFEMTGAAASHAVRGDAAWHVVVTLGFAVLAVVSWALRPPSRTLGLNSGGGWPLDACGSPLSAAHIARTASSMPPRSSVPLRYAKHHCVIGRLLVSICSANPAKFGSNRNIKLVDGDNELIAAEGGGIVHGENGSDNEVSR